MSRSDRDTVSHSNSAGLVSEVRAGLGVTREFFARLTPKSLQQSRAGLVSWIPR